MIAKQGNCSEFSSETTVFASDLTASTRYSTLFNTVFMENAPSIKVL